MRRPYSELQTTATFLSRKTVHILINGKMFTLDSCFFFQAFQGQSAHSQSNPEIKAFLVGSYKECNNGSCFNANRITPFVTCSVKCQRVSQITETSKIERNKYHQV